MLPLLPTSAGSAALITSRTRLAGLTGVCRETVPPLAPEAGVALLTEIGSLCGGLPLALCFAAAKLATNDHLDPS